jgi:hypothetical protein
MVEMLNEEGARAHVFFRRCTLPHRSLIEILDKGRHEVGLHLENSRSFASFQSETRIIEQHFRRKVVVVSKHGSGGARYGYHHHAPYEPEKYVEWAQRLSYRLFLGNLEDPTMGITRAGDLLIFPSAFWLEPHWRDTKRFTVDWLVQRSKDNDVVLLVHPENILGDAGLVADFKKLVRTSESRILR